MDDQSIWVIAGVFIGWVSVGFGLAWLFGGASRLGSHQDEEVAGVPIGEWSPEPVAAFVRLSLPMPGQVDLRRH
jgi:hypothetical protein